MEIRPNVHQLRVPIPDNPLGYINAYLVKTAEGCILVDTGWNTDDAFDALTAQLTEAGARLEDLKYIVITHIHPDHYGLVGRLEEYTDAKLVVHYIERSLLDSRYVDYDELLEESDQWLRINGVPNVTRPSFQRASLGVLGLVSVAMPDLSVQGGEHISLGDFDFEIIWTPGHSPGHICLYERSRQMLFSGDHVLPETTPNVSMNSQTHSNPLVDYLNSLRQLSALPVEITLPGHGGVIHDLPARIGEIQEHHRHRLEELLTLSQGEPKTAYTIATLATWYVPWEELPFYSKRMAVTETLSHLELLLAKGLLEKTMQDGVMWYSVVPSAAG